VIWAGKRIWRPFSRTISVFFFRLGFVAAHGLAMLRFDPQATPPKSHRHRKHLGMAEGCIRQDGSIVRRNDERINNAPIAARSIPTPRRLAIDRSPCHPNSSVLLVRKSNSTHLIAPTLCRSRCAAASVVAGQVAGQQADLIFIALS